MNDQQRYYAAQFMRREIDVLKETYDIPNFVIVELGKPLPDSRTDKWLSSLEAIAGQDCVWGLKRRLTNLLTELRDVRSEARGNNIRTFYHKTESYVRKAERALRHRLVNNEGAQFNCRAIVAFKSTMPAHGFEPRSATVKFGSGSLVWHRGSKLLNWDATVICTPKAVHSVEDHWCSFKNKDGKIQIVINAEEIVGHAFNDQGVTVHKLLCFGINNGEPSQYDYMLCESKSTRCSDGHSIYAHGKDAHSALSLLKRRIKSETLKRLDF